jgi:hypothetical protein
MPGAPISSAARSGSSGAVTLAEAEKLFLDFEKQASRRLRAARRSGFDVAALEAVNAAGRAQLLREVQEGRTSALRQLVADIDADRL